MLRLLGKIGQQIVLPKEVKSAETIQTRKQTHLHAQVDSGLLLRRCVGPPPPRTFSRWLMVVWPSVMATVSVSLFFGRRGYNTTTVSCGVRISRRPNGLVGLSSNC